MRKLLGDFSVLPSAASSRSFALAFALAAAALPVGLACSSSGATPVPTLDAGTEEDAATPIDAAGDAASSSDAAVNKAARCASTFGSDLTAPYGRLDGTVLAIVAPSDRQCPTFNNDHVVLEVKANGNVYRMVVNVLSTQGPPDVYYTTTPHALPAPAFAEGWHTGVSLDYATDLSMHVGNFTPVAFDALVKKVIDAIPLDGKVSVYSSTSGGGSSHLVHRNRNGQDGAIVLDADGASPTFMLFHFDEQQF